MPVASSPKAPTRNCSPRTGCMRNSRGCNSSTERQKKAPHQAGLEKFRALRRSDGLDPGRLCAFRALLHFVADPLPFLQAAEARGVDRGEMHEDICAAILGGNEPEALGVVEPLHGAGLHGVNDLFPSGCRNVRRPLAVARREYAARKSPCTTGSR